MNKCGGTDGNDDQPIHHKISKMKFREEWKEIDQKQYQSSEQQYDHRKLQFNRMDGFVFAKIAVKSNAK